MSVPFAACIALVASVYNLPPRILASIQKVEGGQVRTISNNKNGTQDLGVMQVNTLWMPALATYTGLPVATVRDKLTGDACFNIGAAGAIIRYNLDQSKGDLLKAIGTYHSHTPALQEGYRTRVIMAAQKLFAYND